MVVVHDGRERRATVRRLLALAGPRADDPHVVAPRGEPCRELVRQALRSADRGVAALREEQSA